MNTEQTLAIALIIAVVCIPVACWFGIQIGYLRASENSTPTDLKEN